MRFTLVGAWLAAFAVGVPLAPSQLRLGGRVVASSNLTQADFTYDCSFRLPAPSGVDSFSGSAGTASFYQDPVHGKTLFIAGYYASGNGVATGTFEQVTVPGTCNDAYTVGLGGLTTATVTGSQDFTDLSNGKVTTDLGSAGNPDAYSAVLPYGGKLLGTSALVYDNVKTKAAWVSTLNFASVASATGLYEWTTAASPRVGGGCYMAHIPSAARSSFGNREVASGCGPLSLISTSTAGPGLFAIDAATLVTQPATSTQIGATPLIYFPLANQCWGVWNFSGDPTGQTQCGLSVPTATSADPRHTGALYTHQYSLGTDRINGMLWAEGASNVLFVSRHGMGIYGYGESTATNPPSPMAYGDVCTGSNASVDATGYIVTLPNCVLASQGIDADGNVFLNLTSRSTPTITTCGTHTGTAHASAYANSGTPTARVTVDSAFTPNLTGQNFNLGEINCYDPDITSKGGHAWPYTTWVTSVPVSELAQVYAGTKNPWAVRPITGWTMTFYGASVGTEQVGVAWDSALRKAYFVVSYSDGSKPLVHRFSVR